MDKKTLLIELINNISDEDIVDYLYILATDVCQVSYCAQEQERIPAAPELIP